MRPIKRTRRIKVMGKWRGGDPQAVLHTSEAGQTATPRKRKPIITGNGLYNEVAAAEYLGLSVSTLQNRRSRGEPPEYEKPNGRVFYRLEELERFLGYDNE